LSDTCTYNVAKADEPDRMCGKPAVARWRRLTDDTVRVVTCRRHDPIVETAVGPHFIEGGSKYRKEAIT